MVLEMHGIGADVSDRLVRRVSELVSMRGSARNCFLCGDASDVVDHGTMTQGRVWSCREVRACRERRS